MIGNNHGGIVEINGEWYIFYHRQTNGTEFSRQGCAEKINIDKNGKIAQVEITSCGLNNGPLLAKGNYPAAIACHITDRSTDNIIDYNNLEVRLRTMITEQSHESYITNITDGTVVGYKYFSFDEPETVMLEVRGTFKGTIEAVITDDVAGFMHNGSECSYMVKKTLCMEEQCWRNVIIGEVECFERPVPLYLVFYGQGTLDLKTVSFVENRNVL